MRRYIRVKEEVWIYGWLVGMGWDGGLVGNYGMGEGLRTKGYLSFKSLANILFSLSSCLP
jgi:hypothetical protein